VRGGGAAWPWLWPMGVARGEKNMNIFQRKKKKSKKKGKRFLWTFLSQTERRPETQRDTHIVLI
jgi:hypothetical protein